MPLYKSTVCPHFKYCVFLHVKKDLLDQNDVQEGIKNSRYRTGQCMDRGPLKQSVALQPGEEKDIKGLQCRSAKP